MSINAPRTLTAARLAVALTLLAASASAPAQGVGPHLGAGVVAGSAPGLDDGYVHFGGFVPAYQQDEESLVFADGSLLLFNDASDQIGGNAGLGTRSYCGATGSILGGYVYYDRRDLGAVEFDQVGVGLESLGEVFDARFNVNTPVGERSRGAGATSARSLSTIDGEVGALLTGNDWAQLKSFVGVYGLFHGAIDNTAGVRGRVEARLFDQCFVGGYIEHDEVFDTTGGFSLEYRFGRGQAADENSANNLLARLGDPVVRRKHVVVAQGAAFAPLVGVVGVSDPPGSGPGVSGPGVGGPGVTPGGVGPDGEDPTSTPRPYRPPYRDDYAP